jgi:hypothetical protein
MVSWLADWIIAILNSVPGLFLTTDSPRFFVGRAMLGLMLIVILLFAIAMWPSRWAISRLWRGRGKPGPDPNI